MDTHGHTQRYMDTHRHTQGHMETQRQIHTETHTRTHENTHIDRHLHTRTHGHSLTHMHTNTEVRVYFGLHLRAEFTMTGNSQSQEFKAAACSQEAEDGEQLCSTSFLIRNNLRGKPGELHFSL